MVFKNQKELERFVMKQSRQALMKAQDEIYTVIKRFLYRFYGEYDPREDYKDGYNRTYQFLKSLVQTHIVSDGKGYKAEVYFDVGGLHYGDGKWTDEQVVDVVMNYEYPHGAWVAAGGKPIWGSVKPKLDAEAIDILVDMLKAEGIPITKG